MMDSEHIEDEVVYDKGYTKVILRRFRDKNGATREWGMVHVNSLGKGALVLAATEKGELILERSYRVPMKRTVIELPGGLNDVPGEDGVTVARRELLEETGYVASEYRKVADIAEAPGITDEMAELFIARGARKEGAQSLGESESIEVVLVPMGEVRRFLRESPDPVDAKVYAALNFLDEIAL